LVLIVGADGSSNEAQPPEPAFEKAAAHSAEIFGF